MQKDLWLHMCTMQKNSTVTTSSSTHKNGRGLGSQLFYFSNIIVAVSTLVYKVVTEAILLLKLKSCFILVYVNIDKHNQYMSIKQSKLIVNAHKHNYLNSFCNNGHFYIKQLSLNFWSMVSNFVFFVAVVVHAITRHFRVRACVCACVRACLCAYVRTTLR